MSFTSITLQQRLTQSRKDICSTTHAKVQYHSCEILKVCGSEMFLLSAGSAICVLGMLFVCTGSPCHFQRFIHSILMISLDNRALRPVTNFVVLMCACTKEKYMSYDTQLCKRAAKFRHECFSHVPLLSAVAVRQSWHGF